MTLSVAGYGEMMSFLRRKAAELCEGRLVCVLEGGYHLLAEAWSVRACLEVLLGETPARTRSAKRRRAPACQIDRVLSAVKSLHGLTVSPQTLRLEGRNRWNASLPRSRPRAVSRIRPSTDSSSPSRRKIAISAT